MKIPIISVVSLFVAGFVFVSANQLLSSGDALECSCIDICSSADEEQLASFDSALFTKFCQFDNLVMQKQSQSKSVNGRIYYLYKCNRGHVAWYPN